jgi:FkbM family methyltransferase
MSGRIKKLAYYIANDLLLAPFGLKLSFNIGNDPIQDMARLLKTYPVGYIVDGGAHTGHFSRQMASAFPSSKIEAFEPASETLRALERTIANWPRIRAHKLALGAGSEIRAFHNNTMAQTSSLRRPTAAGEKYFAGLVSQSRQEEVRVISLSEFCREHEIDCLDIIKLDLQGNEMDALRGAGDLVAMAKIVFIEVQFLQIYEDAARFSELDMFLRSKGFDLYQFYALVRSPIDGQLLYGDALFVKPHLLAELG